MHAAHVGTELAVGWLSRRTHAALQRKQRLEFCQCVKATLQHESFIRGVSETPVSLTLLGLRRVKEDVVLGVVRHVGCLAQLLDRAPPEHNLPSCPNAPCAHMHTASMGRRQNEHVVLPHSTTSRAVHFRHMPCPQLNLLNACANGGSWRVVVRANSRIMCRWHLGVVHADAAVVLPSQ